MRRDGAFLGPFRGLLPLVALASAFLGCNRPSTTRDEQLTRQLVGTWITDQSGTNYRFYTENYFHRDGFHSADRVVHRGGETTRWNYAGSWDVKNGKLKASGQVERSDAPTVESYNVEEKIESLTDDELVLLDAAGERQVQHRKKLAADQ
jgi:hypothetical protein